MRFLSSLCLPFLLFSSTYKDHIGHHTLRIESKKLELSIDKRQGLDKIEAKEAVTAYFADKIVIETEFLHYLQHQWLEDIEGGTCHFQNGELHYQNLSYNLKTDSLELQDTSGHLNFLDQSMSPLKAKKVYVEKDCLILEGAITLLIPELGELHAENILQIQNNHLLVMGKMDLLQEDSPTPFFLESNNEFHYKPQEQILTVTSKKDEQILFQTDKLKLFSDNLTLHYDKLRPVRVELQGEVRIESKDRYISFDTLLCDRVDFPLEEDAMLLVTKGRQQHLFWENSTPDNIYLGEGEIPKR
ncbi:MAG: hypothetical protein SNF33_05275 [Candidatus Algichlamydia australiensis]|nr:hypothetical protein [Chlamydiales bacterium]